LIVYGTKALDLENSYRTTL